MKKPCRLELNNSGAWKLIATFDAAIADDTDDILNSAAALSGAVASATGRGLVMRVSSDDSYPPAVLMRLNQETFKWQEAPR